VALTLTPYLGYIFLREKEKKGGKHEESKPHRLEDSGIYKIYNSFIQPLLNHRWKRYTFIFGTVAILLISLALFFTKTVAVKMLPFDNKNEFQVVIDLPDAATLEGTDADKLAKFRAVRDQIDARIRAWLSEQQIYSATAPLTP